MCEEKSVYCKKLFEKYREVVIETELISHKDDEHSQISGQ